MFTVPTIALMLTVIGLALFASAVVVALGLLFRSVARRQPTLTSPHPADSAAIAADARAFQVPIPRSAPQDTLIR